MARLKQRLQVSLSRDTAEDEELGRFLPKSYQISDEFNEGSTRSYRVADGTSFQSVDLAGLSEVRTIYIQSDQAVDIGWTDGTSTSNTAIKPPSGMDYAELFLNCAGITAITVSNSSGSTAIVRIMLAGDPA